jgi:hypothetical protein
MKRVRGSTQIAWMYEISARVHVPYCWERDSVYFIYSDDVYLPQGIPNIYCLSLSRFSLSLYICMYIDRATQIINAIL